MALKSKSTLVMSESIPVGRRSGHRPETGFEEITLRATLNKDHASPKRTSEDFHRPVVRSRCFASARRCLSNFRVAGHTPGTDLEPVVSVIVCYRQLTLTSGSISVLSSMRRECTLRTSGSRLNVAPREGFCPRVTVHGHTGGVQCSPK